jgi:hypothetical protein
MIDIDCTYCGKPFSIKMDNGIYSYTSTSATGKTYAANILKKLDYDNVFVLEYSGDSNKLSGDILSMQNKHYDLIYIDRASLIVDKELFYILLELSKNATVVMDFKYMPKYMLKYTEVASIYCGVKGVKIT